MVLPALRRSGNWTRWHTCKRNLCLLTKTYPEYGALFCANVAIGGDLLQVLFCNHATVVKSLGVQSGQVLIALWPLCSPDRARPGLCTTALRRPRYGASKADGHTNSILLPQAAVRCNRQRGHSSQWHNRSQQQTREAGPGTPLS